MGGEREQNGQNEHQVCEEALWQQQQQQQTWRAFGLFCVFRPNRKGFNEIYTYQLTIDLVLLALILILLPYYVFFCVVVRILKGVTKRKHTWIDSDWKMRNKLWTTFSL